MPGHLIDFMGLVVPNSTYCNRAYLSQVDAHALRVRQCRLRATQNDGALLQTRWPVVSEEYFEYIDVLESVLQYATDGSAARRPYAFVELGSGYGHWTFTAYRALVQQLGASHSPHPRFLLVDVLDSLEGTIQKMAQLNGVLRPAQTMRFHAGYVSGHDSASRLGANESSSAMLNAQVYGDAWGTGPPRNASSAVSTASLHELLTRYRMPHCLDMVDIDIQGSEYRRANGGLGLFGRQNESAFGTIELLTRTTRRVHIGLHGNRKQDHALIDIFVRHGWRVRHHFETWANLRGTPRNNTPFGPVAFGDGVLSVVNGNDPPACRRRH